jgi:hypothetical protein
MLSITILYEQDRAVFYYNVHFLASSRENDINSEKLLSQESTLGIQINYLGG